VTEKSRAVGASPAAVRSVARLHTTIAHDLGVAIVSGQYQPGDVLPGEIEFSAHLKVSRSAYREAVRMLAAKGLVESRTKTGTRVSDRGRWNMLDPEVLAWAFVNEPPEAFVRSLFELRLIIEPAAAGLAATRRSVVQLARLGHALEEMGRHGLASAAGRQADHDFHNMILIAADNEPLAALSSTITAAVRWTTAYKHRKNAVPRNPIDDHGAVFDAIAAGDAARAREAMTMLVSLALDDTRTVLATPPEA
jgi:DNA-binding FadR family transcriptional regulator